MPFRSIAKLQVEPGTVDVVGGTMIVVVGGGAVSVGAMVSELNDRGLVGQSRTVAPPFRRRVRGSTLPPYSRSAAHGTLEMREPLKVPSSNVPVSTPATLPAPPPGVL
jgi:hypothetical protein